jgi:TIR domain
MAIVQTIVVLSPAYLQAEFTQPEWAAAFVQDPQGKARKLIPVRIAKCEPTGVLASIVYADLVGLLQEDARAVLLGAFSERSKPAFVTFPGAYPGETSSTHESLTENLSSKAAESVGRGNEGVALTLEQRDLLVERLCRIAPQHFNMLVFAMRPPEGKIPSMPVEQEKRTAALVAWAEEANGYGISALEALLETVDTALFSEFSNHIQFQWWNPQPSPSCYVAIELLVYATSEKAFAKLLEAQKQNPVALETYRRVKNKLSPECRFWMAVARHHQIANLEWARVQRDIEWQYLSNPGSLYRAWNAWNRSLSSGDEFDQLKTILEVCSGQRHNPEVMELYRAAFATNPEMIMDLVHGMIGISTGNKN